MNRCKKKRDASDSGCENIDSSCEHAHKLWVRGSKGMGAFWLPKARTKHVGSDVGVSGVVMIV